MERIKCPNCGSTAQVTAYSGNTYSCGCGCWFTIINQKKKEDYNQMTAPYKGHPYD